MKPEGETLSNLKTCVFLCYIMSTISPLPTNEKTLEGPFFFTSSPDSTSVSLSIIIPSFLKLLILHLTSKLYLSISHLIFYNRKCKENFNLLISSFISYRYLSRFKNFTTRNCLSVWSRAKAGEGASISASPLLLVLEKAFTNHW